MIINNKERNISKSRYCHCNLEIHRIFSIVLCSSERDLCIYLYKISIGQEDQKSHRQNQIQHLQTFSYFANRVEFASMKVHHSPAASDHLHHLRSASSDQT